ncbi:Leucine rich repeat protein [compost metagenome]
MAQLRRLEILNLHGVAIGPGQLASLRQLPRLSELNLHLLPATPQTWSAEQMSVFASIRSLRVLRIIQSEADFAPGAFDALTQLHSLSLRGNLIALTEETAGAWRNLAQLQRLDLAGNPLVHAPIVTGMSALVALNLENTLITSWPEGLEGLANVASAVLARNAITSVPPQAGAVPGLRMSRDALTASVRERVEREMLQVDNHDLHTAEEAQQPFDLMAWADEEQRDRWGQVLNSPVVGRAEFTEVLAHRVARLAGGRMAVSNRVQRVLDAMSRSEQLRNDVFTAVVQMNQRNYGPLNTFNQIEGLVEAYRITSDESSPLAPLIALGRRRRRQGALRGFLQANRSAWRPVGQPINIDELLYYFMDRLQQPLGIVTTPGAFHYPEYGSWVTQQMLDDAAQAIRDSDRDDLERWRQGGAFLASLY